MTAIQEKLELKHITLATRLVCPPMATHSSGAEDGAPTEKLLRHYEAIARNPLVGLLELEHAYIAKSGTTGGNQLSLAEDRLVPQHRALVARLHAARPGIAVISQINHAGAKTASEHTGGQILSASNVPVLKETPRPLTVDEIHQLTDLYAQSARRAQEAGYDGVEIHCAHGYLLNQFYSPLTNKREDEYGPQNLENRTRFLREVIHAVRKAVGSDYPVSVRLGGSDYTPGGSTAEDAAQAALLLAQENIDFLSLTGGLCGYVLPGITAPGWFGDQARAIRQVTDLPLLLTGGYTQAEDVNKALAAGTADLIGVGRSLYKDPNWGLE